MEDNKNNPRSEQNNLNQKTVLGSSNGQVLNNQILSIDKHSNKWRKSGILLAIITLVIIIGYLIVMGGLMLMARSGQSGTEFIALLFLPVLFLIPLILVVDGCFAIAYLIKGKPGKKEAWVAVTVLLVCILAVGWLAYQISGKPQQNHYKALTLTKEEAITHINNCEVKSVSEGYGSIPPHLSFKNDESTNKKQYLNKIDLAEIDETAKQAPFKCGIVQTSRGSNDLKIKAITQAEFNQLLAACRVKIITVYYRDNIDRDSSYRDGLLQTGIAAQVDNNGNAHYVEVRSDLRESILSGAHAFQEKCSDIKIYRKEKNI